MWYNVNIVVSLICSVTCLHYRLIDWFLKATYLNLLLIKVKRRTLGKKSLNLQFEVTASNKIIIWQSVFCTLACEFKIATAKIIMQLSGFIWLFTVNTRVFITQMIMDHDEQYRFIYAFCYKVVSYTDADVHGFASASQQQHLACACQYAICWLKFLYSHN